MGVEKQDGKKKIKRHYIVTGAAGHLGSTVIRHLLHEDAERQADFQKEVDFRKEADFRKEDHEIENRRTGGRNLKNSEMKDPSAEDCGVNNPEIEIKIFGFLLHGTKPIIEDEKVSYFYGDITDLSSLRELFERAFVKKDQAFQKDHAFQKDQAFQKDYGFQKDHGFQKEQAFQKDLVDFEYRKNFETSENNDDCELEVFVIHSAALISIEDHISEKVYDVNVNGTRNILSMCKQYKVNRLVHVSSVHAIAEMPRGERMSEVESFSPDLVVGGYAKSKAMAVNLVLNEIEHGLDAVIVFPSGIIGPYDEGANHMIQMFSDFISGRLKLCVSGGYDFVDVRDVADGCISAAHRGLKGEGYILSGRYITIKRLLDLTAGYSNKKPILALPLFTAKMGLPFISLYSKWSKKRPLYTKYSLYTLAANSDFSNEKARKMLGYRIRKIEDTVSDTVRWLASACHL